MVGSGTGLAVIGRRSDAVRPILRNSIIELARAHGNQLRYAQFDAYRWPSAQSDVDLVDLHLAGLVALSDRALRRVEGEGWAEEEFWSDLPPLARVSLTVGLQLARFG